MKTWLAIVLVGWVGSARAQEKPAAPPAQPAAPVEAAKELPSARAVIDRYVEAIGGREAFLKKNSVLLKGKTEVAGKELGGAMTLATARPNKLFLSIDLAGIPIRSGFDGTVGWQVNPLTGPSIMEGKELSDMARQADFFAILHEAKNFKSMENLGKVDFEGEECHKLKLVHTDGSEVTEFYSVKTGLQSGFTGTQESSFGPITATSVNHEHKQFGDLTLPSRVTQKMVGLSQTMIVESVEFDTVPESTFALPPEIKALAGAPTAKEEPAKGESPEKPAIKNPAP